MDQFDNIYPFDSNLQFIYNCVTFNNNDFENLTLDIDECEWHRDGCDQECINTVGSFICACRAGYALISR